MSKFTDYIDSFADKTGTLAKEELKELIIAAKKNESEFVRLQAENVERWTVMLAAGELTPKGYKKLVSKLDAKTIGVESHLSTKISSHSGKTVIGCNSRNL